MSESANKVAKRAPARVGSAAKAARKPRKQIRRSGEPGSPPRLDGALLTKVARRVEILNVDLLGAYFERADDDPIASAPGIEASPQMRIGVAWKIDDDQHLLGCVLTFATRFEGRGKEPYNVIAQFRLLYQVDSEFKPTRAELDQFAHWNAMFNAWPYWREYLSSTINRAHLPQFVVPVMTVPIPNSEAE